MPAQALGPTGGLGRHTRRTKASRRDVPVTIRSYFGGGFARAVIAQFERLLSGSELLVSGVRFGPLSACRFHLDQHQHPARGWRSVLRTGSECQTPEQHSSIARASNSIHLNLAGSAVSASFHSRPQGSI